MKGRKKNILCFFGTRPEAIKMAPVVLELNSSPFFKTWTVVSAQHRDLLDQVLRLFGLKVAADLDVMQEGQSLFDITTRVMKNFENVLSRLRPDLVLVHGDTTTTFAGSLASAYLKIPVGHVEAGLRTFDRHQPFPEEINRHLTDALCDLYFCPTQVSKSNLQKENIRENLFVTGNTVIDALLRLSRTALQPSPLLKKTLSKPLVGRAPLILLTAHRRENFGMPFERIFKSLKNLAQKFPSHHWIYPVHPNPNVRKPAARFLSRQSNIHLVKPLDYADVVYILKKCHFVVTDSGGLQEEAPSLGKPVLVLREVTERPEAVAAGTVRLVGSDPKKIEREVAALIVDKKHYGQMSRAVNPYGDGKASIRIRQALEWYYGFRKNKPEPFRRSA